MKLKKSLGQHFLTDTEIIDSIVRASETKATDTVLEIGPGEGILTRELLETGAHVISVEKDDRLIPVLQKKFTKEIATRQFNLIHADVLDLAVPHIPSGTYRVVGNIPYYITGQIMRMFLESNTQPYSMTLLVQKEVAERIVSKDGKESLLSLSVKIYGTPHYVQTVGRDLFTPIPAVDSAILHIKDISKEKLDGFDEKTFFKIIHAGFAHKRKQLIANLSTLYNREYISKKLIECGLAPTCRAEDISIDAWIRLIQKLGCNGKI